MTAMATGPCACANNFCKDLVLACTKVEGRYDANDTGGDTFAFKIQGHPGHCKSDFELYSESVS